MVAGPYGGQSALVFHPDDPLFARFRQRIETEQGTLVRKPKPKRQPVLPLWLLEQIAGREQKERGIVPLESNALALRYDRLRPGPDLALVRPEHEEAQGELLPPSVAERRLRARIGEMVAAQAVEDEGEMRAARGQGSYHRYNAALKRAMGGKGRDQMTLAELEATAAWLERNRLSDHVHLLDGDARCAWAARQLGRNKGSAPGEWVPPVGRPERWNECRPPPGRDGAAQG